MPQNPSTSNSTHPAPQRGMTDQGALWFSVFAAPLGWALHLLVNYSIAGQNCVGAADIGGMASPGGRVATILLIDLAATLLALVAGYIAYRRWLDTQSEKGGGTHRLVQTGEGRTRFLAMFGMLTSALFGVAVVMDAFGVVLGPPC